jgi:hypothetical protein
MPFSTSYANNILNWTFGKNNSLPVPTRVFLGLSTNDPEADNGAFTELTGDTYKRVLIAQNGQSYPNIMGSATDRGIENISQITWTKATTPWLTAKGFGLFQNETGGDPYFYGRLENEISVPAGAVALFDPQTLKITFPATDTAVTPANS